MRTDFGGKDRMGLWAIVHRNGKPNPAKISASIGIAFDHIKGSMWLLSIGISPGVTIGIGWVTSQQRAQDALDRLEDHAHTH